MQQMTEAQAIKILEDVTAQVNMNRDSHYAVISALNVLKNALLNKPCSKPEIAPQPK